MRVREEEGRLLELEAHPDGRATAGGPCVTGLSYVDLELAPTSPREAAALHLLRITG